MYISKFLISLSILLVTCIANNSYAKSNASLNNSLTYANVQLDKFTDLVSASCSKQFLNSNKSYRQCTYLMFNNEYISLDKRIKKAYGKDNVGYTYFTMSLESLCSGYMKDSKELNSVFKERICYVKYSYGQLKYMGLV